jgi:hypothetical protein
MDLFPAGAIADIAPKLRSIFSQLLIISAQLPAALFDFIACITNIFEILANLLLVMVPLVVMTNITPIVMLVISSAVIPSSFVVAVPPPVRAVPSVVLIGLPKVRIPLAVLGVGGGGYCRNN